MSLITQLYIGKELVLVLQPLSTQLKNQTNWTFPPFLSGIDYTHVDSRNLNTTISKGRADQHINSKPGECACCILSSSSAALYWARSDDISTGSTAIWPLLSNLVNQLGNYSDSVPIEFIYITAAGTRKSQGFQRSSSPVFRTLFYQSWTGWLSGGKKVMRYQLLIMLKDRVKSLLVYMYWTVTHSCMHLHDSVDNTMDIYISFEAKKMSSHALARHCFVR
jgi:hypothetical protein